MKKRLVGLVMSGILLAQSLIVIPFEAKAEDNQDKEVNVEEWSQNDYNFYMYGSGGDISEGSTSKTDSKQQLFAAGSNNASYDIFAATPSGMKMSSKGLNFVMEKEGIYLDPKDKTMARAYDDLQPSVILTKDTKIKGTITIGYGHTGDVDGKPIKWDTKISVKKAQELFAQDMNVFERPVNNFSTNTGIKFNQGQFDALVSFSFNVGAAWTTKADSSLRKMIVNGVKNYSTDEVINTFSLYNHSCGMILAGLTRRRRQEAAMFLGDNSLAAYKTGKYTVDQDGLSVRTGPGTNNAIVKKNNKNYSLSKGKQVEITEIGAKGNEVYWGKFQEGWISLDYCRFVAGSSSLPEKPEEPAQPEEPKGPDKPAEPEYEKGVYVVQAEALNVRAGAGTSYKATTFVKKNEKYNITEVSGYWGKMNKGWISLRYCKLYKLSKPTVKGANKAKGIEVSWKSVAKAQGYLVYKYENKKWVKYATISSPNTLAYTDTKVKNSNKYQYKVYAYEIVDGGKAYSDASAVLTYYRVPKTTLKKVKAIGSKRLKVYYSKGANITGYQITYSQNKKFTAPKFIEVPGKTKIDRCINNLTRNKVYYVSVRTYIYVNGKRQFSPWSNILKAKVK